MGRKCMPGMYMPGCTHRGAGTSIGHGTGASPIAGMVSGGDRVALAIVLALAALGLALFTWRLLRRGRIPQYDWVADWVGHGGAHAVGMILMSIQMLGWVSSVGPAWVYLVVYAALAVLFGVRGIRARDATGRRHDVWHVFAHLSMVYMFATEVTGAVLPLTVICLVLYGALMGDQLWSAVRSLGPDTALRTDRGAGHWSSLAGHLAISWSMVVMFGVMQWPSLLG